MLPCQTYMLNDSRLPDKEKNWKAACLPGWSAFFHMVAAEAYRERVPRAAVPPAVLVRLRK